MLADSLSMVRRDLELIESAHQRLSLQAQRAGRYAGTQQHLQRGVQGYGRM